MSLLVLTVAGATLSLAATASGAETSAGACPITPEAMQGAVLRIGYFPYARKLRAHVDLRAVPGAEEVETATLRVLGPKERERLEVTAPVDALQRATGALFDLPELEAGEHRVRVEIDGGPGCGPMVGPQARFEHRTFGWEHNGLGEGEGVIPPFTPIAVSGRSVAVVGRRYRVGELGLWDAIESVERPLLRAPARLEARIDGQPAPLVAETAPAIQRRSDGHATWQVGWRAGRLRGRTEARMEVDGLVRVDLVLAGPPDASVDVLDLVVPLRAEHATLFNAISDGTLHHRLDALPTRSGVVWRSQRARRSQLPPEFVPYVWIGDETRGFAWMAESTRDWLLADDIPTQQIVRTPEGVDLVVRFATRGGPLGRERRLSFAVQATPVKPRPDEPRPWRRWQLTCDGLDAMFRVCPLGSAYYWGSKTPYGHIYPIDHDYTPLELIARARERGMAPGRSLDTWLAGLDVDPSVRERMAASLRYALRVAAKQPDGMLLYISTHKTAWTPEFSVYNDEWRQMPFGDRAGRDANPRGEVSMIPSESFRDYALWYFDRMLETGAADGFFFDNTYLRVSWDPDFGTAYVDDDGRLRPGVDLFALRELFKRTQILVHRRRGAWYNLLHMTTTPVSAVHGWAGFSLDGEREYGSRDYQLRFPRDTLRAGSLGSQTGTVPVYLPGLRGAGNSARKAFLERSLAGVTAVHEIRVNARIEGPLRTVWEALYEAGYGDPDCRVLRYWDPDRGFTLEGGDAEALLVACRGRVLALVVGFDERDRSIVLRVDEAALGLSLRGCRDLEGGPVHGDGATCSFVLPRHDFRLLSFGGGA